MVKIFGVEKDSIADSMGIAKGDELISVNGYEITDLLDYKFYIYEKNLSLVLKKGEHEETYSVIIKKRQYDDLGLEFATYMMDEKKSCKNKCIFCFIDQLPQTPRLRDTLYFKDDDERLSFLYGNYITLTNLLPSHIDRIIKMRISPVNISIHTTNKDLRVRMMNNKSAGDTLDYIKKLCENNINVNTQIVLCKNVNDGEELVRTVRDLSVFYPSMQSIAVVPAGLTKYREGLYPLEPFTETECAAVIDMIDGIAEENAEKFGQRLVYCSDEFYLKAKRELPPDGYYEGYPQIENGVGMMRDFLHEFDMLAEDIPERLPEPKKCSVATGVAAYPFICGTAKKIESICKNFTCLVYEIKNEFFGENITAAGLLTGGDLIKALAGRDLGDTLYISRSMLRYEGDLFLDGVHIDEVAAVLNVKVYPVGNSAADFIGALCGLDFT